MYVKKAKKILRKKPVKTRRQYRRKRKTVMVNRALQPVPQRYICKMKYCETISFSSSALAVYRWRLNSIFDPNLSGTGHQPYGRDTYANLYNRYRVFGCHYAITATAGDTSTYLNIAALPANEAISPSGTISEVRENPRARYCVQAPAAPLKTLKGYVSLPSLMGRNKAQYMADDRYQAQMGENPAEAGVLNVFFQSLTENIVSVPCTMVITVVYHVELFDPINLGQS